MQEKDSEVQISRLKISFYMCVKDEKICDVLRNIESRKPSLTVPIGDYKHINVTDSVVLVYKEDHEIMWPEREFLPLRISMKESQHPGKFIGERRRLVEDIPFGIDDREFVFILFDSENILNPRIYHQRYLGKKYDVDAFSRKENIAEYKIKDPSILSKKHPRPNVDFWVIFARFCFDGDAVVHVINGTIYILLIYTYIGGSKTNIFCIALDEKTKLFDFVWMKEFPEKTFFLIQKFCWKNFLIGRIWVDILTGEHGEFDHMVVTTMFGSLSRKMYKHLETQLVDNIIVQTATSDKKEYSVMLYYLGMFDGKPHIYMVRHFDTPLRTFVTSGGDVVSVAKNKLLIYKI